MKNKKKKLFWHIVLLSFLIFNFFVQIGNYVCLNLIDTYYFSELFKNWDKKIYKNITLINKCDHNPFKDNLWITQPINKNYFNIKIRESFKPKNIVIKQFNNFTLCGNNEYFSNYFNLNPTNNSSTNIIDSLNNNFEIDIYSLTSPKFQYNNSNGKKYIFSAYTLSYEHPYFDPKCNILQLKNDSLISLINCKDKRKDLFSFPIENISLSTFLKENNITDNYSGKENITLYGKLYSGTNIDCYKKIKGNYDNDNFINDIEKGINWLSFGFIIQFFLILSYFEKFLVSKLKNKGISEILPNYVKPVLMISSLIYFIISGMVFAMINLRKPKIFKEISQGNCIDENYFLFIKSSIEYYKISEILNYISLFLSFIFGIKLGIIRAIKYAN